MEGSGCGPNEVAAVLASDFSATLTSSSSFGGICPTAMIAFREEAVAASIRRMVAYSMECEFPVAGVVGCVDESKAVDVNVLLLLLLSSCDVVVTASFGHTVYVFASTVSLIPGNSTVGFVDTESTGVGVGVVGR